MKVGYIAQLEELKKLVQEGEVDVMFMHEAGEWFFDHFETSPPSTQVALQDYEGKNIRSIWYYCENYRLNLYADEEGVRVRDMFLYDEGYTARYGGDKILTTHDATHDNLPVMNGLVWTKLPQRAGIYFCDEKGERIALKDFRYEEKEGCAIASLVHQDGEIVVCLTKEKVAIKSAKPFALKYEYVALQKDEEIAVQDSKCARFKKRGYEYFLVLGKGRIGGNVVDSEEGEISCAFTKKD
jgi:hypothetical protein